jgi:hypothetical protein
MRALSFDDHLLDVNPVQVCCGVALLLMLLSLCVLDEQHTDEEVQQEE